MGINVNLKQLSNFNFITLNRRKKKYFYKNKATTSKSFNETSNNNKNTNVCENGNKTNLNRTPNSNKCDPADFTAAQNAINKQEISA